MRRLLRQGVLKNPQQFKQLRGELRRPLPGAGAASAAGFEVVVGVEDVVGDGDVADQQQVRVMDALEGREDVLVDAVEDEIGSV